MVEVVNAGVGVAGGVLRGKEDPRDYMSNPHYGAVKIGVENHRWQMVKIDSDELIQGYITSTDIDFKLLGYTIGADPAFFAAPAEITPGTIQTWVTVDLSSLVDSDADGVILFITGDGKQYGIREMDSSYSTTNLKTPPKGNAMYSSHRLPPLIPTAACAWEPDGSFLFQLSVESPCRNPIALSLVTAAYSSNPLALVSNLGLTTESPRPETVRVTLPFGLPGPGFGRQS